VQHEREAIELHAEELAAEDDNVREVGKN